MQFKNQHLLLVHQHLTSALIMLINVSSLLLKLKFFQKIEYYQRANARSVVEAAHLVDYPVKSDATIDDEN